ncbi:MAG: TetR/AcrR family transcriptional regulator [Azoarcus sp.]|nr:TetR/AcrR family transcriptional regulator [Azoarcus sp.]
MDMTTDVSRFPASSDECSRAALRRTQILDAAAQCFRTSGFHGASIASISRLAGMSTGHIYHYFDNKEAIIAAIVQRDLERLVTVWAELRAARDVCETMVARSAECVTKHLDADVARLQLEILTEATRNPEVARTVYAADCCCMASLVETLRLARRANGRHDDDATLVSMAEVLAAMFEGLMIRAIRNPGLAHENLTPMVQHLIRQLIAGAGD